MQEGKDRGVKAIALERVRNCEAFERERCRRGVPDRVVGVEWVMHVTSKVVGRETVKAVVRALVKALGISAHTNEVLEFQRNMKRVLFRQGEKTLNTPSPIEDTIQALHQRNKWALIPKIDKANGSLRDSVEVSVLKVTPTVSKELEKNRVPFWNFTFISTFDAVSEFTTSTPVSNKSSIAIRILALMGILTIYIVEL